MPNRRNMQAGKARLQRDHVIGTVLRIDS